ncbi:MAG: hypothetical protein KDD22_06085 [Bdellovibrionales bacterium]|nr:hypothetical protein [Bdellovibrionales bacterium]
MIKYTLMAFLILASCARPKYLKTDVQDPSQKPTEIAALCHLKFSNSGLCLSWFWEGEPPASGQVSSLIFKIYRLNAFDQTPIEVSPEGSLEVKLWMPDMGHGSTPVNVEELDEGTFRASKILFIMTGHWEIEFHHKQVNTEEMVSVRYDISGN